MSDVANGLATALWTWSSESFVAVHVQEWLSGDPQVLVPLVSAVGPSAALLRVGARVAPSQITASGEPPISELRRNISE